MIMTFLAFCSCEYENEENEVLLMTQANKILWSELFFCILMSDSDVIFAADCKNHICFSPSSQIFSLLAI